MKIVSNRTGFSPSLLRAWERRHGLLAPARTDGGHRLYTEEDMAVLDRIAELLDQGLAIGDVARVGREALLADRGQPAARSDPAAQEPGLRDELVAAAVALDGQKVEAVLDYALATASPVAALQQVIEPALERIGELWAQGRCSVAGERLATGKILARLLNLLEASNAGQSSRPRAICACLPDEQHEVGALVTAYALSRQRYRVAYWAAACRWRAWRRPAGSCSLR